MGIADAAVAMIKGRADCFDVCLARLDEVERLIDPDDDEIELHAGDGLFVAPHMHSKNDSIRAELAEARKMIEAACQTYQNCLAAV